MNTRKLAVLVLALVLGVAVSVAWYLAGERVADDDAERESARPRPAPTSSLVPGARGRSG